MNTEREKLAAFSHTVSANVNQMNESTEFEILGVAARTDAENT